MAGVSVSGSGGGGGRRAVDANVNMVPMIDLLIAVIAFLLMTAVWVQSGALRAQQPRAGTMDGPVAPEPTHVMLAIGPTTLRVGESAASVVEIADGPDQAQRLRAALAAQLQGPDREVWIQPDSAVSYDRVIHALDAVYDALAPRRGAQGPPRDVASRVRFM